MGTKAKLSSVLGKARQARYANPNAIEFRIRVTGTGIAGQAIVHQLRCAE